MRSALVMLGPFGFHATRDTPSSAFVPMIAGFDCQYHIGPLNRVSRTTCVKFLAKALAV